MQTIDEILASAGIEGDAAEAVKKGVQENYRTIAEVQEKAAKIQQLKDEAQKAADEFAKLKELDGTNAEEFEKAKARIAELEASVNERAKQDEESAKAKQFAEKFAEATKGKEFAGDLVRDAVASKARALTDANPDMTIEDAIDRVVGDGRGVWANPQRDPHKMPQSQQGGGVPAVTSLEQVKSMSADDINKNWEAIQSLLAQQKE